MDENARRISDELRHKHIRTLEVMRELVEENNAMRDKLELGTSDEIPKEARPSDRRIKSSEDFSTDSQAREELQQEDAQELRAELALAQAEANKACAAEEANELTLVALLARNTELETASRTTETKHKEQVERLEAVIVELQAQLASTVANAQAAQARAKLDASRLESEVAELRHDTSHVTLNRVGTPWADDGDDDESVLSQREVEDLQKCLRKASRRESTAKRRCVDFERQAKSEAIRREIAERELYALQSARRNTKSAVAGRGSQIERIPLRSVPHRNERLKGVNIIRKSRNGAPMVLVNRPLEATSGPAAENVLVGSHSVNKDKGVTAPISGSRLRKKPAGAEDEETLGAGIRRLRESEKILCESNAKLQRELKHSAKRLEKAECFASDLAAELKKVAGDGVSFETFVVLRRDNQALKAQLAEIKQAYSMILASSPSRKVNISFSDPALREALIDNPSGNIIRHEGVRDGRPPGKIKGVSLSSRRPRLIASGSAPASDQRCGGRDQSSDPSLASPTQQRVRSLSSASSLSRGRTAPLRAVCHYKRAASLGSARK